MDVNDLGHSYNLRSLDGEYRQMLTFVKRCEPPEKYPGNENSYPGTTSQEVTRALLERSRYVQGQNPCPETEMVIQHLQQILYLLESRANRVHGRSLPYSLEEVEYLKICLQCGHVTCEEHPEAKKVDPWSEDGWRNR